ncbi:MAG: lysophospholipid acyltransferase family protein [Gemmataceae bacterium]|nr:lysophospholipid acyltransferase family protein [Gemmataceae bacterium]
MSTQAPPRAAGPVELPRRWPWLLRGFRKYARRYARKHFHAVRVSKTSHPFPPAAEPVLVVLNHPSWWDPLVALILAGEFTAHAHFGAIDAVAVERYGFFKRLGFIGVDTHSLRGATEFLRVGAAILSEPGRAFWVTAQGRFTDPRVRPLGLRSGVGHLAARLERGAVVPVAFEYPFWDERTPEVLIRVGEPVRVADRPGLDGKEWTAVIEAALTRTADDLAADAMTRDPARFTSLVGGRTGIGGVYDLWRRAKALARGERFDPSHAAATAGREARP